MSNKLARDFVIRAFCLVLTLAATSPTFALAEPPIEVIDPQSVPVIRPTILNLPDAASVAAAKDQYGPPSKAIRLERPDQDHNAYLRMLYPVPLINIRLTSRQIPLSPNIPGVEDIHAYDPILEDAVARRLRTELPSLWTFRIPAPLRDTYWSYGRHTYRDPWYALALYGWRSWSERDPELFFADTRSGVKWQRAMPLQAAMTASLTIAGLNHEWMAVGDQLTINEVKFAIAVDGERIIAMVPLPYRHMTIAFVYSGSGELLRQVIWPRPWLLVSPGSALKREPNGHRFEIEFSREPTDAMPGGVEQCLIDDNANLLCRYEDEDGKTPPFYVDTSLNSMYKLQLWPGRAKLWTLPPLTKRTK